MRNSALLYIIALVGATSIAPAQNLISTGSSATTFYGGALINFQNTSSTDLRLTGQFDIHLSGVGGFNRDYSVWYKNGALSGQELSANAWTLLGTVNVASTNAQGTFTRINVGQGLTVNAGQTIGLAFFANGDTADGAIGYRFGANTFSDSFATITTGLGKGFAGTGNEHFNTPQTFSPRTWSGTIQYEVVPEPMTMAVLAMSFAALARRRQVRKEK
jgi:hypothetical protein